MTFQAHPDPLTPHGRSMAEALMHRVNPLAPLTELGRQMRGLSLLEMAREFLIQRGVNVRGFDRLQLAREALAYRSEGLLASTDFSSILANVASKRLRMGYEQGASTYRQWATRAPDAPDFKNISVVQLSNMPDLLQVSEHGAFQYGSLSDSGETYRVLTYGRVVGLTRQAVVNDDLRAFDSMAIGFGASAARLENRTVYAQLTANGVMADGVALFHASRNNLQTGAGSVLSSTALSTMRTAMRLQTGLQGEVLNIAPRLIIVPVALEQLAYQLTSSQYVPATQSAISEFRAGGRTSLEPVVEPILDANSSTAWYGAASGPLVGTVEYCYLDGAAGPLIESKVGFDMDGIKLRCRLDFAAKATDAKGLHKAAGA